MISSKNKKDNSGFTLIELLVVISIISLLSSIVLAALSDAKAKARDVRRMQDLKQIGNALELYRSDNGEYPHQAGYEEVNSNNTTQWNWLNGKLSPKYISSLPKDPLNMPVSGDPNYNSLSNYSYLYSTGYTTGYGPTITIGSDYDLVARLEKTNNIACPNRKWLTNTNLGLDTNGKRYDWCDPNFGGLLTNRLFLNH